MILISAFCCAAFGQDGKSLCPKIEMTPVNQPLNFGVKANILLKVDESAKKYNLEYNWTFSMGKILTGQGTSIVEFIVEEPSDVVNINATVKITGLPKICSDTISEYIPIFMICDPEPADVFGKLLLNDLRARLDSLFARLVNDSEAKGVLKIRFDKKDARKYKISRLKSFYKHIEYRRMDKTRFSFIITEGDSEQTEFWIIPNGALSPIVESQESILIKAEELKQKINQLFPKK